MPALVQYQKTRVCTFWLKGRCRRSPCSFAHGELELRNAPDLTRTSMCRTFAARGQCPDQQCTFAHSYDELRTTDECFKTRLCDFVGHGLTCRYGILCRHAHSVEELHSAGHTSHQLAAASGQSHGSQPSGVNAATDVLSSSLAAASSGSAAAFSTSADPGAQAAAAPPSAASAATAQAAAAAAAPGAATGWGVTSLPAHTADVWSATSATKAWTGLQVSESDTNNFGPLDVHGSGFYCGSPVKLWSF
mmetsp:Transcript_43970/g.113201  ORF Transcript_43970/g.113201 Transcript_43970/m.113201 type:complete len:248 (-) Transcript_43970:189-932(-)